MYFLQNGSQSVNVAATAVALAPFCLAGKAAGTPCVVNIIKMGQMRNSPLRGCPFKRIPSNVAVFQVFLGLPLMAIIFIWSLLDQMYDFLRALKDTPVYPVVQAIGFDLNWQA